MHTPVMGPTRLVIEQHVELQPVVVHIWLSLAAFPSLVGPKLAGIEELFAELLRAVDLQAVETSSRAVKHLLDRHVDQWGTGILISGRASMLISGGLAC